MRRYGSFGAALALAVLSACANGGPPYPEGWTHATGSLWTATSGAGVERYRYAAVTFSGGISDLASQQAIETLQRYPGARLVRSVPFAPCPGQAGLGTYALPGAQVLEVAFAVVAGRAVTAEYQRPKTLGEAREAMDALRRAVCVPPA